MSSVAERQALVTSRLIDHIARVDLRVVDIGRALTFYRDIVGLEVADASETHAELRSTDGPVFLTIDSDGVTAPADPRATGLFHHAIRFPTRPTLGDALARLVDADYEIGAGDHLVSEALYIDDPSGNGVELYWDRPVEVWPAPSGDMMVPMATLPVDLQGLLGEGGGRAAVGESAPRGTDMGHVHLQVSDIDTTVGFYRDIVGLDLTGQLGSAAAFFSSNGYHHHLGTNSWRSRGGAPARPDQAGLSRVTFAVADASELGALKERLEAGGRAATATEGEVVVADPHGIELRFITEAA